MKPCIIAPNPTRADGHAHCHEWRYGKLIQSVHVLVWVDANGRLPAPGMEICHSRMPGGHPGNCIELTHLREDTHAANMADALADGVGQAAINARKTHCPRGHEYSEENTYRPPGDPTHRMCRICLRITGRKHDKKRRSRNGTLYPTTAGASA